MLSHPQSRNFSFTSFQPSSLLSTDCEASTLACWQRCNAARPVGRVDSKEKEKDRKKPSKRRELNRPRSRVAPLDATKNGDNSLAGFLTILSNRLLT